VIEDVVEAIRAGKPVLLPTDTVYGLCADAHSEEAVRCLYGLKGRAELQPTALIAASVEAVYAALPELHDRPLLTGPYTLIVRNPRRRFRWLTGERPETIGVRVPDLVDDVRVVLDRVGVLAATSANLPGGPDPRRLDDVPRQIRAGCAGEIDGGELPGTPSTVIDLTRDEPIVLREGAVSAEEALRRVSDARAAARG
jgi:L-threonylcarbamoyladenylate synthase